jgi:fatty-acyl-CoA synthase
VPASGGVLHALILRLLPDEIAYIANHGSDRFLIVDDVLLPVLDKIKDKVKFERVFVVNHCGAISHTHEDYEGWLKQAHGDYAFPAIDEQDGAAMCFTSGTTGNPKGVLYSHRALALHTMAQCMADSCGISQRDSVLMASAMFHVNGWGLAYSAAMAGAKLVLPGPFLDATIWMGVLAEMENRGAEWRPPREMRILCGGTAAPESLMRGLDRHGMRMIHSWGMTETSPQATVSYLRPAMEAWTEQEQYTHRAKQGYPLPFIETRLGTEHGVAPWDGQTIGELEVRGPWVAASYYKAPETKDRWTKDGWFRTGDMAVIDPDGCVRLVDRSKDMVKSGGEWISSVDVENELVGHPAVREAAVIAVPHEKWQERPLAVVVLREGAKATTEELREFLGRKFARWQLPDNVVFVSELPHTSTGKLLKAELRRKYSAWQWQQIKE